ncbi:MAG: 2-hydroxyacid dehydrogenase [Clostridiales bacterium]|jgi:D-isomer specific 2-hydroxyacid dehydrogenase NAD-binding|nr:2-hydroxyacid dehydrogenase [Clostridiales bacterium]
MQKFAFFDTKPYDKPGFEKYGPPAGIEFKYYESKLNEDTAGLADGCSGVIVFVNDTVDAPVINRLYDMGIRLIALRCAGFNNVDLKTACGKMHIVRVPAYSPYAVAEHAMAMLLTSIRRIHKAYNRTREFNFSLNGLSGFDLHGKNVGVIGTGKIGKVFIDICKGFGMQVCAYDPYPDPSADIHYVTLKELFAGSDIISLHCPLTNQTEHLINAETIACMKKGVVIINTSRGGLIDAEALTEGIKTKQVGAACLDVYEEESEIFYEDNSGHILQDDVLARLISMPNVLLTSHQAFLTEEALNNIAEITVRNIEAFLKGETLENEICYQDMRQK